MLDTATPLYEPQDEGTDDEPITTKADLRTFKRWYKADKQHAETWRTDAEEDYAFVSGEQWTTDEKQYLKDQLRPAITFNRIEPLLRSVSGAEVTNRQEVRYIPREEGDARPDEVLTSAGQWFRDESDAEDEESDAFLDATICGMGWTETRLDMESNPEEPMPVVERIDPLEMLWDCNSRRRNLVDSTRVWRVRRITKYDALVLVPDADLEMLDAKWAEMADTAKPSDREASLQYNGTGKSDDDDDNGLVTLVQVQWCERKAFYKVADETTGQATEMSEAEFKSLEKRAKKIGLPIQSVRLTKKVHFQAFIGREVLKVAKAPCPDHFTFQCVTAFRDRNRGTFYGLVKQMKDPQRWANKWLSQTLHIMNSDSKGGIVAEKGIAENDRQFEKSFAKSEMITWVNQGALSGNKPRFVRKEVAQFPAGFFNLMQFALSSIRDTTGINLEMLGQAERDQPASLEYQRRQAGMTILATLFDSLRRYRKNQGRVMLYYIQNHLNDGRLIRIVGQDQAQYVPLALKADAKYDIIVDDSPSSPNQKEMTWATLQPMLAVIGKMIEQGTIPPGVMLDLAEYSPIPPSVIDKIKQRVKANSESPQVKAQDALKQKMAELEARQLEMDGMLKAAQAEKAKADAQVALQSIGQGQNGNLELAQLQAEMQMKAMSAQQDAALNQQKAQADIQLEREKAQAKIQLEQAKTAATVDMQRQKTGAEMQIAGQRAQVETRLAEQTANTQNSLAEKKAATAAKLGEQKLKIQAKAKKAAPKPK